MTIPDNTLIPMANDPKSWTETLWVVLEDYRENLIPEGDEGYDYQWNEITTAMAWIEEELGIQQEQP